MWLRRSPTCSMIMMVVTHHGFVQRPIAGNYNFVSLLRSRTVWSSYFLADVSVLTLFGYFFRRILSWAILTWFSSLSWCFLVIRGRRLSLCRFAARVTISLFISMLVSSLKYLSLVFRWFTHLLYVSCSRLNWYSLPYQHYRWQTSFFTSKLCHGSVLNCSSVLLLMWPIRLIILLLINHYSLLCVSLIIVH